MTERVFIGLGSNLGDRQKFLDGAVRLLGAHGKVVAVAPVIETPALLPPEDPTPQPSYLNTVVELSTGETPEVLARHLHDLERSLGRERRGAKRWAARTIDLDLLFYGGRVLRTASLIIPHERAHERLFVMEPLSRLAPDLLHPVLKRTMRELRDAL